MSTFSAWNYNLKLKLPFWIVMDSVIFWMFLTDMRRMANLLVLANLRSFHKNFPSSINWITKRTSNVSCSHLNSTFTFKVTSGVHVPIVVLMLLMLARSARSARTTGSVRPPRPVPWSWPRGWGWGGRRWWWWRFPSPFWPSFWPPATPVASHLECLELQD